MDEKNLRTELVRPEERGYSGSIGCSGDFVTNASLICVPHPPSPTFVIEDNIKFASDFRLRRTTPTVSQSLSCQPIARISENRFNLSSASLRDQTDMGICLDTGKFFSPFVSAYNLQEIVARVSLFR